MRFGSGGLKGVGFRVYGSGLRVGVQVSTWAVANILVPGTDLDSVFPACRLMW